MKHIFLIYSISTSTATRQFCLFVSFIQFPKEKREKSIWNSQMNNFSLPKRKGIFYVQKNNRIKTFFLEVFPTFNPEQRINKKLLSCLLFYINILSKV